jgi:hypothetical protein
MKKTVTFFAALIAIFAMTFAVPASAATTDAGKKAGHAKTVKLDNETMTKIREACAKKSGADKKAVKACVRTEVKKAAKASGDKKAADATAVTKDGKK